MASPSEISTFASEQNARMLQLLGENAILIDGLRTENAALKAQLADRSANCGDQRRETGEDPLRAEHEKLLEAYNALKDEHRRCDALVAKALRKYQAARDSIHLWRAYADRQLEKRQKQGEPSESARGDNASRRGDPSAVVNEMTTTTENADDGLMEKHSINGNVKGEQGAARSVSQSTCQLPTTNKVGLSSSYSHEARATLRNMSSQTTESEPEIQGFGIKRQSSSDDEPVVVSERQLKRPRSRSTLNKPPPRRIKLEHNSAGESLRLISDDDESTPVAKPNLARFDTLDSCHDVEPQQTPRLRRSINVQQFRAVSEEATRSTGQQIKRLLPRRKSSLSEGGLRKLPDVRPATAKTLVSSEIGTPCKGKSAAGSGRRNDSVLRPISNNLTKGLCGQKRDSFTPIKTKHPSFDRIKNLSEDGEDFGHATPTHSKPKDVSAKAELSKRLSNMLDGPSPDTPALNKRANMGREEPQSRTTSRDRTKDRIPENLPGHTLATNHKSSTSAASVKTSTPSTRSSRQGQKPLRSRPLDSLQLDDFRINPKFMGSSFAFADPIRSREEKRCLPGCTRPDCCGNLFRDIVEIGGAQVTAKSDDEALEEYLGPDYAEIIAAYTPVKRKDLTMQAHAFSFANQHGSHRQAYERRSTPPGFWRTDMPSTQEAEEDRRKAQAWERQKVEERWRDASRDNGRWIFRDE